MSIIGQMTKSRGSWGDIKPVTKIKQSKKNYSRKKKHKSKQESGD